MGVAGRRRMSVASLGWRETPKLGNTLAYARTDKRKQLIGDQTTFSGVFSVQLEHLPYVYISGLSD